MEYETDFFLNWYKNNYFEEYKRENRDKIFNVDDLAKAYNAGQKSCNPEKLKKIIDNLNEWKYHAEIWLDDKRKELEHYKKHCSEQAAIIQELQKKLNK